MPSRLELNELNFDNDSLVRRVAARLAANGVRNTHVVVAFSGGADSTALLLCLHQLCNEQQLTLTAAHLDHALRPESGADAEFVRQVCESLKVPVVIHKASSAQAVDRVSEATARDWRREFLRGVARDRRANWVATAHTADDQAETVLHRILRGTGLRGLTGIAAAAPLDDSVRLLRPLLDVSRGEIESWLHARCQAWRIDATNAELRFTRNRIRHQLLPRLREEFNPRVNAALLRLAQQADEVSAWLTAQANDALDDALLEASPDLVRLSVCPLQAHPLVLVREVFVRLWQRQAWREQSLTAAHWDELAGSVQASITSRRWQLPHGIEAERDGQILRLRKL